MTSPDQYDAFAAAYAADNEDNVWNARYERPAVLSLMPPLARRRVLDAGCGAGAHAAALVARGARVVGVDGSAALLSLARDRLGPDVPLHHADLADPLPLDDASFEVVLASLVLHYLENWGPTLREFHRVLVPGGSLVLSTHHPIVDYGLSPSGDYFRLERLDDRWTKAGETATVSFWRRPLQDIVNPLLAAGFALTRVLEPPPAPEVAELDPDAYHRLTTGPAFLFLTATSTPA